MNRFWRVRSRWDYVAFIALAQWSFAAIAVVALIFSLLLAAYELRTFDGWFLILAMFFGGLAFICNALSVFMPLATVYGSKHHEHMTPGVLYHLAALLFGPIVGVHYLYRTRGTNTEEPPPTVVPQ